MTRTSETKRAAQQSVAPRFVRAVSAYAASDADCVRVAGKPSSLEAASSQTWASCTKDTRTSFAFASRAHLKHSSAIVRYSVAVFMGRCASRRNSLAGFPKLVCRRPDSTKELLASLVNLRRTPAAWRYSPLDPPRLIELPTSDGGSIAPAVSRYLRQSVSPRATPIILPPISAPARPRNRRRRPSVRCDRGRENGDCSSPLSTGLRALFRESEFS